MPEERCLPDRPTDRPSYCRLPSFHGFYRYLVTIACQYGQSCSQPCQISSVLGTRSSHSTADNCLASSTWGSAEPVTMTMSMERNDCNIGSSRNPGKKASGLVKYESESL